MLCLSCSLYPGTYAPEAGLTQCLGRTTSCAEFEYVNLTTDPTKNNGCVVCTPCSPSELVVAYDTSTQTLGLLAPGSSSTFLNGLCPGYTTAPYYRCVSNTPQAGLYLAISQSVGAALGTTLVDPYAFQACNDPLYNPAVVQWVAGPSIATCYVGCRYGVNQGGVNAYLSAFRNVQSDYPENTTGNMFLQRMLQVEGQYGICTACPLDTCPLGRFRPNYEGSGCGPPCALPQFQGCQNSTDGCTEECSNKPQHAGYIQGSATLGQDDCPWVCLLGWHLSDDRGQCLSCALDSGLCNSSDYALAPEQECMPWSTSADLCKYCPPVPYATLVGWNQSCEYRCYVGYYLNGSTCLPCHTVWLMNWSPCPVGFYLNEALCFEEGGAPVCMPCEPVANVELISNGGLNSSGCRGMCPAGFHTVSKSTGAYMNDKDLQAFPPAPDVLCVACTPTDGRSCLLATPCFPGSYRNLSVADGQPGSCVPCRVSAQCAAGFYAPACLGANVTDAPCLPCDQALVQGTNQQFVDYAAQQGVNRERVTQGDCPRACINNYVQQQLDPTGGCVSCKSLALAAQAAVDTALIGPGLQCLMPGVEPPICAFVYAYWNAAPGLQWWGEEYTPPFLVYSSGLTERAGVCWACPIGTATLADSEALCVELPGYTTDVGSLPTAQIPIPSLPSDVYLVMQQPVLQVLSLQSERQQRRLLSVSGRRGLLQDGAMVVAPCPFGSYKPGTGAGGCYVCPQGASTVSAASISKAACLCTYGHYLANAQGLCAPCPPDTYQNTIHPQPTQCTPCPTNQSTLGNTGATSCACALGYYRQQAETCVLCPAGFYCPPCTSADSVCPTSSKQPCFPGATSRAGSFTITNCTCGAGMVLASRPKDNGNLYCMTLPLGATGLNPITGLILCAAGWTRVGDACQLCAPGFYAAVDSTQQLMLTMGGTRPFCVPCPLNTYNPTTSAMGACTSCPPQQSTRGQGSTSLQNCSCPSSTTIVKGGCAGCASNQYAEQGACKDCPTNSLAQPGASSVADCLCLPGFELSNGTSCQACPQGFYSTHSSNAPCVACPKGSTTAGSGATQLTACGESAGLCLSGYGWLQGVGCYKL